MQEWGSTGREAHRSLCVCAKRSVGNSTSVRKKNLRGNTTSGGKELYSKKEKKKDIGCKVWARETWGK